MHAIVAWRFPVWYFWLLLWESRGVFSSSVLLRVLPTLFPMLLIHSRTLLSILVDLNNVVSMVSARPPTSNFSCPFTRPLVIVPSSHNTIGFIVTLMFYSFLSSLARSWYLSIFSLANLFFIHHQYVLLNLSEWFARGEVNGLTFAVFFFKTELSIFA